MLTHGDDLYILGSDTRGTMWGVYHFAEACLGVDPMYLWTDRMPKPQTDIELQDVSLASDGPSFKFRGWFVNDEDFLTEWQPFEGRRNNDYKYYARIMHPSVSDKIIETALRLQINMIIPSSFNDILNSPEAYAVNKAAQRGLIVTQHHIEPLGVGGFNFDDYFERQGKEAPLFSYLKNPNKLEEVWTKYVEAWAAYPDVIWQLGLRGRGDRAIWAHDPSIPKDDAARGAIISDAIKFQYDLVRKHDPDGYMTLTLWLEMARLMEHGHIKIPDDINIIFADNSPGWGFSPDFYRVERNPAKQYGIYYHLQLWGTGPHFIQGISPQKTYEVISTAVDHHSDAYCMLNVGNVREFVQGLTLTSQLLFNYEHYSVQEATGDWFKFYYGEYAEDAAKVYRQFYDHYRLDTENKYRTGFTRMENSPYLLDGHLAGMMKQMLTDLNQQFDLPKFKGEAWVLAGEERQPRAIKWGAKQEDLLAQVRKQAESLESVNSAADALHSKMKGHASYFFDVNLRVPAKMFHGLMLCTAETMLATKAESLNDRQASLEHLKNACDAIHEANIVKQAMLRGHWKGWYRGEYKIMFSSYEQFLNYLVDGVTVKSRD